MFENILSPNGRAFFIAEIGLNHNGDAGAAAGMIDSAARIGAGAVKFQTFVPELLSSPYTAGLLANGREGEPDTGMIEFFRKFVLSEDDLRSLKRHADSRNILFFSSVFDVPSLELLERLEVPLYKIASSEITNLPLIRRVARTGKPAILSTGISTEEEIGLAIEEFRGNGGGRLALLHCVSKYPVPPESVNLRRIISLRERFHLDVGFSDHTDDIHACAFAASMGARIFEKHFTADDSWDCPDREVSLTPERFSRMMELVNRAILMEGDGSIGYGAAELDTARAARRSLFAGRDIPRGALIQEGDLVALRPGIGIPPGSMDRVAGKKAQRAIMKGEMIREEHFR